MPFELSCDASTESDHVLDELTPEVKQASDGVAEMAVSSEADNPVLQIEVDLLTEFSFDFLFQVVGVRDTQVVVDKPLPMKEGVMIPK